jgi:hypothetical protein
MTWPERLVASGFLILVAWLAYRYGELFAIYWLAFGIFVGLCALLEELRRESRNIKKLLLDQRTERTS